MAKGYTTGSFIRHSKRVVVAHEVSFPYFVYVYRFARLYQFAILHIVDSYFSLRKWGRLLVMIVCL